MSYDGKCYGGEQCSETDEQDLIPTDGVESHQLGLLAISLCLFDGSLLSHSDMGDPCIFMGDS